ncbi:radical SAM protein [Candidatus Dependentiae bacterium]|nr:radical SAM protein [Candidatus Dependentiae bacterium]
MTKSRVIYEPRGKAKEYAELAGNLFETCYHGCVYCFSPYVLNKSPKDFFAPAVPKDNIIRKIMVDAKALKAINEKREILLCFTCDPYQSNSKVCKETTRAAISILFNSNLNVTILTKGGTRTLGDIDLFEAYKDQFRYGVTLTFANDSHGIKYEPHAAVTSNRISALRKIHDKGIRTWVSIEPAWSVEDTIEIINRTHEIVDEYKIGKLNYHPHANEVDWDYYTKTVIERLRELDKEFYVKEDLKQYI